MKTKIVRVDCDTLYKLKIYYESQLPEFIGKFNDSLIINIALEHALGNQIQIVENKNKIRILK